MSSGVNGLEFDQLESLTGQRVSINRVQLDLKTGLYAPYSKPDVYGQNPVVQRVNGVLNNNGGFTVTDANGAIYHITGDKGDFEAREMTLSE